ncbi:hypothetical protein [Providencia sp. PROV036]|uniref:hypothetical protein n=1 Tax=Providencia sp. PROV036 TaxID=2949767 RepID=UPI00234B3BB2|nr:hypothetical protein [Providencia sp. PROV036]
MMEWKGIPYSLDAKEIMESVNNITTVAVDKIPAVVVSTSFSWETVVAAFFSALIPSLIAWYALRHNYKLAEYQNTLVSKEKWISDFRSALAEFISEAEILTSKIDFLTFHAVMGNNIDEKPVELSKYNLLLLLIGASKHEIEFSKSIVNISNSIMALKAATPARPGSLQQRNKSINEIQAGLRKLLIDARHLIIAKYDKID